MASLSLFHLRAIFYGANIGIYFIAPKKTTIFFSHTAINFKSSSTPTQRKRPLQPPIVRPRTAHLPKRAGAREAGGARGGPHGGTERHNRRAAPALVRATPFRPKKGGANGSGLGHFFDLSGSFSPMASTASDTYADARSEGGETGEKALARTRAQHRVSVFRLHPPAVIQWSTTRYG